MLLISQKKEEIDIRRTYGQILPDAKIQLKLRILETDTCGVSGHRGIEATELKVNSKFW